MISGQNCSRRVCKGGLTCHLMVLVSIACPPRIRLAKHKSLIGGKVRIPKCIFSVSKWYTNCCTYFSFFTYARGLLYVCMYVCMYGCIY